MIKGTHTQDTEKEKQTVASIHTRLPVYVFFFSLFEFALAKNYSVLNTQTNRVQRRASRE